MSKMKHLLRKLHIGDHHHHERTPPAALDPSPSLLSSSSSTSPSSDLLPPSDLPRTTPSSENESSNNNFNFFEEEFQMQLALAISVSDPGQNPVDSETVQIDAAKQISLGCSPSQSLPEFLSLRYATYNVLNYDEKIIDGFYDICGIDSNLSVQAKMPSLVDLEAISVLDDVGYEVILVNRSVDAELLKLEERVHIMSKEYRALDRGLNTNILAQKLANLIVERMGGPVADVEEMFWRWRSRNHELRVYLNTVMLPLGSLDVGHSRQRALLFKVLADRINLPCKLVKGSYYTGTDEGAINLIKLDSGSEYIIDLMGAPGTLIPAEVPSGHHQCFGLDARSIANFVGIDKSSSTYDLAARMRSSPLCVDEATKPTSSSTESYSITFEPNKKGRRIASKIQNEQLIYDANAAIRPVSENSALSVEDLLSGVSSHDLREDNVLERNALFGRESAVDQCNLEIYMCNSEEFLATSTGVPLSHIPFASNRKRSAEGLRETQFKLDIPGYKLPVSSSTRRDLVEFRNEDVNPIDDTVFGREQVGFSGNEEAMEIACSSQFNTNKSHNMQIDHAINGVAEILWEELQIGERIGIGSYGEVYRGEWNGTEVAVKKFMKQDISGTALAQFKCEIEIMMRLRHPNVVLFMGAVMRPPNMSILTEFLPRGSLYKLLHRPNIQVDEKKRIKMALDVVKGMNYLHTSSPIIVHRDLKSPNLLVDKNWVVKVCDFGMSRLQHNTFLSSKSAAGTAEWMAPEVLRNEPSNEKSDIYSFGVILWELATMWVPWTEMNSMQVVGAVGWQGRHLDIPDSVDPMVAEIISDCWNRNPQARPSFAEIITRLKGLRGLSVQRSENH